ncbi:MAG: hypothetical protein Q7T55_18440 [Solirubrobacteraceae bacterium]|nr:hypothetical protein [Solirubrobacteraceae bacterium]
MAAKDRAEQGAHQGQALFEALRDNPYVQRVLADEDLRDQVRDAYDNGRSAYARANKAKRPTQALLKDKKLQNDLRSAFFSAKAAQEAFRDAPQAPKGRRGGKGKLVLLALVGTGVALVASSGLRDKVLDLLFGPEETFDYVPTSNGNGTAAAAAPAATSNAS